MRVVAPTIGLVAFFITLILGILLVTPWLFHNRVKPTVSLGSIYLGGLKRVEVAGVVQHYNEQLQDQSVTLKVRDAKATQTIGSLGLTVDVPATVMAVQHVSWLQALQPHRLVVAPQLAVNQGQLQTALSPDLLKVIKGPQNATLKVGVGNQLALVPGKVGEGVDETALRQALQARVLTHQWQTPVTLQLQQVDPAVRDSEVEAATFLATTLLKEGMTLTYNEQTWQMKPYTVARLLQFQPVVDPSDPRNQILGVNLELAGLTDYLKKTITPEIDRPAQNARFERSEDGQVTQFAVGQSGLEVQLDQTVAAIAHQLADFRNQAQLAVAVTEPAVATVESIQQLGITTLLAHGETDFAGSPANRIANIHEGTSRYQGLLIPPGAEFSFDQYLGPVDGEHGFKPELVIKQNVTTPEFGGGLCQVSTTLFRTAVFSGMKITQRRNHAYAVRYYGEPGFDATIYPPYTDLRFTNNTPGYILIQASISGTHLSFDFWGTSDGRKVEVDGPHSYDRQPDGSVKATLTQKVTKDDQTIIDDTFYSRYKSPKLFPHVTPEDPSVATPT